MFATKLTNFSYNVAKLSLQKCQMFATKKSNVRYKKVIDYKIVVRTCVHEKLQKFDKNVPKKFTV